MPPSQPRQPGRKCFKLSCLIPFLENVKAATDDAHRAHVRFQRFTAKWRSRRRTRNGSWQQCKCEGHGHRIAFASRMRLALLLAFSVSVFAQSVQVGVEGGVPLAHVFEANILSSCAGCSQRTLPYLIGPKVEIHLWRPLYLDAEALYNRADYGFSNGTFLKNLSNRWEIPILLKLQFNSRHFLRPFVAAGVSLQHSYSFTPPPAPNVTVGPGVNDSAIGATVAAGMRLGFRWVRPSIELRYTRWADPPIGTFAPTANPSRMKRKFWLDCCSEPDQATPIHRESWKGRSLPGEYRWASREVLPSPTRSRRGLAPPQVCPFSGPVPNAELPGRCRMWLVRPWSSALSARCR